MGTVVLADEELIRATPEKIFSLFGRCPEAGWLFGLRCDAVEPGAVARFTLPADGRAGTSALEATGRIVALEAPHRIVVDHETPWRGRVTCTIRRVPEGSRVRLVAEVPDGALRWLLGQRGVELPPETGAAGSRAVGLLVSQSGPASVYAAASENLARLAVEEVNADGGLDGRPLRLVAADDGTRPARGAAAMRRLTEVEGCRVVVTNVTSATFDAVEPVAAAAGALLVYTPVNEGGRTGQCLVRMGERPAGQLRRSIPQLMASTGGRAWYLAGNDYCWPRATNRYARSRIERVDGIVVGERYAGLGSRDFAVVIDDIARSGADLVVSTFVGADEVEFERQCFDAGLRDRCRTIAPALDEATRQHIGDRAAAGLWTVFGYFEQLPTSANADFLTRYRARFGRSSPPVSSISESVYEALHLVAAAARRARSWQPAEVGRALASARFDGPRGPVALAGPGRVRQPLYLAESVHRGFRIRDSVG